MYADLVWILLQVLVAVGLVILMTVATAAYGAKRGAGRIASVTQLPSRTSGAAKQAA